MKCLHKHYNKVEALVETSGNYLTNFIEMNFFTKIYSLDFHNNKAVVVEVVVVVIVTLTMKIKMICINKYSLYLFFFKKKTYKARHYLNITIFISFSLRVFANIIIYILFKQKKMN